MAALSAITMGASKVMVVDRHPDRLRLGTIGVYVPQDPGGPNELAKHGIRKTVG